MSSTAEKVSFSISPDEGPVERVGEVGAEAGEVEAVRAASDLLVDGEADARPRPRFLRVGAQVGDGGHDLGDPRLVVRPEQGRPVRGDDVVADALGQQRAGLRREHLARVSRQHDLAAPVVAPDARLDTAAGGVGARIEVCEQPDAGRVRGCLQRRKRRVDVAGLCLLDIVEAELAKLAGEQPSELELGGRRGRRRRRAGRRRLEADVTEEAFERVVAERGGQRGAVWIGHDAESR